MNRHTLLGLGAAALTAVTIACSNASPSAPTPSSAVNAPQGSTLKATTPVPESPVNSQVLKDRTPTLTARAAVATHAPTMPLQYQFELLNARNDLEASAVVNGPSWKVTKQLAYATTYRWRVRVKMEDGSGPWSDMASFKTPEPPDPTAKCGPPTTRAALAILQCHRRFYPAKMRDEHLIAFLKGSARHLNAARVPGGPFGVLRKLSGNNCHGFSCDIICSGQGPRQRQYDVLLDENVPKWGPPLGGQKRIDQCIVQR